MAKKRIPRTMSINDGEKVFMKTRTGRAHYMEVIKEMGHIKDMPPAFLLPTMAEWVLACEIRRSKSRNINGNVARQMREYLIKLYFSINEIKSQKEKAPKRENSGNKWTK